MKHIVILFTVLGTAISALTVTSCKTTNGSNSGSQLVSVIPSGEGEADGLGRLAAWKAEAEVLAKSAPESAKVSYQIAQKAVDIWVNRKGAESQRLANRNFGTVKLDEASVSGIKPMFNGYVAAAKGSREESAAGTAAAIAILRKVAQLGRQSRAASAEGLRQELDLLRWEDWDSLRG